MWGKQKLKIWPELLESVDHEKTVHAQGDAHVVWSFSHVSRDPGDLKLWYTSPCIWGKRPISHVIKFSRLKKFVFLPIDRFTNIYKFYAYHFNKDCSWQPESLSEIYPMWQQQCDCAKWVPSIETPLLGTGWWDNSWLGPERTNIYKLVKTSLLKKGVLISTMKNMSIPLNCINFVSIYNFHLYSVLYEMTFGIC